MLERASTCGSAGSRSRGTSAIRSPSVTESTSYASTTDPGTACTTPNTEARLSCCSSAGDKSSQQKDIDKAKRLNAEYEG